MHGGKSIAFQHKGKPAFIHSFPHSCEKVPFHSPCRNSLSITPATAIGNQNKKQKKVVLFFLWGKTDFQDKNICFICHGFSLPIMLFLLFSHSVLFFPPLS